MTYKTDVEAPAIVIEPKSLNLKMEGGESRQVMITVENKGRISAFNVKVLEAIGDEAVKVYTPNPTIGELKAGEKVSIPVTVTLVHANCHYLRLPLEFRYYAACGRETLGSDYITYSIGDCDYSTGSGDDSHGDGGETEPIGGGSAGGGGGNLPPGGYGSGIDCGTEPVDPSTPIDPDNPDPAKKCVAWRTYDHITGRCLPFTDLEGSRGFCATGALSAYYRCVDGSCILTKENCVKANNNVLAYSSGECPNRIPLCEL